MDSTKAPSQLYGRVALVTGAGRVSGMGAATARQLARLGATVVVTDVARPRAELQALGVGLGDSMEVLEGVASEVRKGGSPAVALALDVTDAEQATDVVDEVIRRFGRLDILVNNAGTTVGVGEFTHGKDAEWDLSWQVNVLGMARLARLCAPHLSASGVGAIVNVASTAGLVGIAGYGAYNVTKHAVVGLTRLLAAELGPEGVRVNAVAPGSIHTDMGTAELTMLAEESNSSVDAAKAAAIATVPLRRLGTAHDVAEVIGWLASSAGYVTGQIIAVDGGSGR